MSRLLAVSHDDRPVPEVACWWQERLSCHTDVDEHGNIAVQQMYMPPDKDWREYDWWAASFDYFDGRNDWSWPFKFDFRAAEPTRIDIHYIAPVSLHLLSVLDVVPPNVEVGSKWMQQTQPGDHRLPAQDGRRLNSLPRPREHWNFSPVPAMPRW